MNLLSHYNRENISGVIKTLHVWMKIYRIFCSILNISFCFCHYKWVLQFLCRLHIQLHFPFTNSKYSFTVWAKSSRSAVIFYFSPELVLSIGTWSERTTGKPVTFCKSFYFVLELSEVVWFAGETRHPHPEWDFLFLLSKKYVNIILNWKNWEDKTFYELCKFFEKSTADSWLVIFMVGSSWVL